MHAKNTRHTFIISFCMEKIWFETEFTSEKQSDDSDKQMFSVVWNLFLIPHKN